MTGGKKVKLAFISNVAARKQSYRKRKKGLMKKVREITILCDVPGCAIISDPFKSKTEVWPDPEGAKQVIERYQNLTGIDETTNVNQEGFLLHKLAEAKKKLEKITQENRKKEVTIRMNECMKNKYLPDDLSVSDLKEFDKLIEKKLEDLDNKIVEQNGSN